MSKHTAALKIQGFFTAHRLKKQIITQQAIDHNPHKALLKAIALRFQCMRAVAAAKFPINKPLEDPAQIARVIQAVIERAKAKEIANVEALTALFQDNIVLSTMIQTPYYDVIWRSSHRETRDLQKLMEHAYAQLCHVILKYDVPVVACPEKSDVTSEEILALAREIISYASHQMIDLLAHSTWDATDHDAFIDAIKKILANYMTPSALVNNQEMIHSFTQQVSSCMIH